ncbi:heavy-metal-associated domain-containing protein [Halobacterium bonnevillei]|uniref:Heavy metal transporter n=1 Tax=Halobacterium bonnevillei TaxID=2692200 RepID=A0A6B0SHV1_9EURY|nr:cation transporter [Halobacterium bonnevillei]MXR21354.1 heavy metal transporter [Halobacterium bonnevillei]
MATTLTVDGMGCSGCEDIVENALTDVAGVGDADADHVAGAATVEGNAAPGDLVEAVDVAGYEATVVE